MSEYEPLTDPTLVTQKLRAAVQRPDKITDQVLFESVLDVIASRGSEIALNLPPQILLSLGHIKIKQIGAESYESVWLNRRLSGETYEGYEVIINEGTPKLYSNNFEAKTQTTVPPTNTALRLRLLQLLLDG